MFKGNVGQSDSTYNHSYQSHPSQLAEDEALSRSLENMNFGTAAGKNSCNSLGIFLQNFQINFVIFMHKGRLHQFMCWHSYHSTIPWHLYEYHTGIIYHA